MVKAFLLLLVALPLVAVLLVAAEDLLPGRWCARAGKFAGPLVFFGLLVACIALFLTVWGYRG